MVIEQNQKRRHQIIESLVLLAVVIIIVLVVFSFIKWFPGVAGSLPQRQGRLFWSSQFPVQITDYKLYVTDSQFVLENTGNSSIQITNVSANGITDSSLSPYGNAAELAPGRAVVFTSAQINCTSVGAGNSYDLTNLSIGYNVIGGMQNEIETGSSPLIGNCQSS